MTIDAAIVVRDQHHRLRANEGAILVAPLHASIDHGTTATVLVTPATDYQINTDLTPHLELAPPRAVETTPVRLTRWDHGHLALALDVIAHEAGHYAIRGTLHFAVCKREQCFPKIEPIELALDVH